MAAGRRVHMNSLVFYGSTCQRHRATEPHVMLAEVRAFIAKKTQTEHKCNEVYYNNHIYRAIQ